MAATAQRRRRTQAGLSRAFSRARRAVLCSSLNRQHCTHSPRQGMQVTVAKPQALNDARTPAATCVGSLRIAQKSPEPVEWHGSKIDALSKFNLLMDAATCREIDWGVCKELFSAPGSLFSSFFFGFYPWTQSMCFWGNLACPSGSSAGEWLANRQGSQDAAGLVQETSRRKTC